MLRVVTVADRQFVREASHLQRSLLASNPDAHLTIYCDRGDPFAHLTSPRCVVEEIADMPALGAKRSKLTAWHRAVQAGSFLYLDADAIVLKSLAEVAENDTISGCSDDLSHCPFIADKHHPWPHAQELRNEKYINSGLLWVPVSRQAFIDELYEQGQSDETWNKYIFPDKLFDNHFLCALLTLRHEPVCLLDQHIYGWQGFWQGAQLQVERRADQLVNKVSGKALKVVLFAGQRQSFEFFLSLPVEVASLLLATIMPVSAPPDEVMAAYLSSASSQLAQVTDPHHLNVLRQTIAETRYLLQHTNNGNGASRSYFRDPDAMRAYACAQTPTHSEWNGLQCGGAYLEGEEYNFIRKIVRAHNIRSVLEIGAGETSILFSSLGLRTISIEYQAGSWLHRAQAHGCQVLEVPFDDAASQFQDGKLRAQLEALQLRQVDLLFIDSPVGTGRRRNLLSQMTRILPIRHVLYHDANRDAVNVFRDQKQFALKPLDFLDSTRGLVLLEITREAHPQATKIPDYIVDPQRVEISLTGLRPELVPVHSITNVRINVANHGTVALSSRLARPVMAAYHWLDEAGKVVVFDGVRTELPFDLLPGDSCSFPVNIATAEQPGHYQLQISLVQEQVCWFHQLNQDCLISLALEVGARLSKLAVAGG